MEKQEKINLLIKFLTIVIMVFAGLFGMPFVFVLVFFLCLLDAHNIYKKSKEYYERKTT